MGVFSEWVLWYGCLFHSSCYGGMGVCFRPDVAVVWCFSEQVLLYWYVSEQVLFYGCVLEQMLLWYGCFRVVAVVWMSFIAVVVDGVYDQSRW